MQTHIVPERFRRAIVLHLAKNALASSVLRPPLILGVHGTSGDGKTYQCEMVLRSIRVRAFLIAGSQLESDRAGEPARLIRETYIDATRHVGKTGELACIVINDFDAGVGNWGEKVQYTVNRQLVFGELMHLVDYPDTVRGEATRRTPIVVTGNDFTQLYPPLLRPGRMTLFEWKPELGEKLQIVAALYPELSRGDATALVTAFETSKTTRPIAFYSALRTSLLDDFLWEHLAAAPAAALTAAIRSFDWREIAQAITLKACLTKGKQLLESGSLQAHLRRS